jgi:hypothetical protein
MRLGLISGTQDTRKNGEDFAITPFLFGVKSVNDPMRIYGLGLSWGWWAIHLSVIIGLPKGCKRFIWNRKI